MIRIPSILWRCPHIRVPATEYEHKHKHTRAHAHTCAHTCTGTSTGRKGTYTDACAQKRTNARAHTNINARQCTSKYSHTISSLHSCNDSSLQFSEQEEGQMAALPSALARRQKRNRSVLISMNRRRAPHRIPQSANTTSAVTASCVTATDWG